jgi:hypothetical protein
MSDEIIARWSRSKTPPDKIGGAPFGDRTKCSTSSSNA